MRLDKLTTKFQQALADAQSLALGQDNPFIEPPHLLLALLQQEDGSTASLLQRAGVNVPPLRDALRKVIERLPKVEGTAGEITLSRDLANLLNVTDKEAQKRGDQFIASEMFLLALTQDKGDLTTAHNEARDRTPVPAGDFRNPSAPFGRNRDSITMVPPSGIASAALCNRFITTWLI